MKILMSNQLKQALRIHGGNKLAAEIERERGNVVPEEATTESVGRALAMKMAADFSNEDRIQEGLSALRRLQGQR